MRIILRALILFMSGAISSLPAAYAATPDNGDKQQGGADTNKGPFSFSLTGINITGGISTGYFYSSNPGEDTDEDGFLLSNFLVEISSSDENLPVGFVGAFGETSTPSLLSTPENSNDFTIEYASLILRPVSHLSFEAGLLEPNAGYENTYTYNNKNIILGAIASQQPYNAYGARVGYEKGSLSIWGGYYKNRLDDEEYNDPDYAWEIELSSPILENTFTLYHFNIKDQRSLTGVVLKRTIDNIDLAFNMDYWRWSGPMKELYDSSSSIGAALYVCPNIGKFSIPLRLEYVNQKNSQMYIESPDTGRIFTVTISPTWHFNDNSYIKADTACVKADEAFADKDGSIKDNRINIAVELGLTF